MLSALGGTRAAHLDALAAGRTGLAAPAFDLPFETAVGAVGIDLPELPSELASRSTRMARMAAHLVNELGEPLERARARWRPERIGILLGTSTAGAETTERAYRTFVEEGTFPVDYDFRRQHTFGAVLHVVSELTGAKGPAWMASTACTSESSGRPAKEAVCSSPSASSSLRDSGVQSSGRRSSGGGLTGAWRSA